MSSNCKGEHKHDDCQCDHDNHDHETIITLTLEDGRELKCEVLVIFEVDSKDYIVLLPEKSERVFIYGYEETEEGPNLSIIESDTEYEKVADIYKDMQE